jgi:DNA polymerase-3 subunit epsilon
MDMFADTETTGLWDFKASSLASHQPHLVQLSAILPGGNAGEVQVLNTIVKPHGYTSIPVQASNIHGITYERAMDEGVEVASALEEFNSMATKSCESGEANLVFHNSAYDTKILFISYSRARMDPFPLLKMNVQCTMKALTNVIKIPGARGYKWPKLMEAYRFYFNEDFIGAHDAKADTEACMKVYYAAKERGHL